MKNRTIKRAIVLLLTLAMLITSSGISVFAESMTEGAAGDETAVTTEQTAEETADEETEEAEEAAPAEVQEEPAAEEPKEEPAPAKDAAPAEEKAEAAAYPAFEQSEKVDGVTVKVTAGEGTFPEGAKLLVRSATKAEESKADKLVEKVRDTEKNIAASYTFDISVVDKDGSEIQPKDGKKVNVAFAADEMSEELLTPEVYHIDESGWRDKAEALDVTETKTEAIAETDGFSTYQLIFAQGKEPEVTIDSSDGITAADLLDLLGVNGKLYSVVIDDDTMSSNAVGSGVHRTESFNNMLDVKYTGSETNVADKTENAAETDAADWKITEVANAATGTTRLVITLSGRPTYYVSVVTSGQNPEHRIFLRHVDGKEVTSSNPARSSEQIEVGITGYTNEELAAFKYSYVLKCISGSNTTDVRRIWYYDDRTDAGNSRERSAYQTPGIGSTTTATTPTANMRYFVKARAEEGVYDITVTVTDSSGNTVAGPKTFSNFKFETADLQKDLNDAARQLQPIIFYKGGTEPVQLIEKLGNAGIVHIFNCTQKPAPSLAKTSSNQVVTYDEVNDKLLPTTSTGHEEITFTLSKNNCGYHNNAAGTANAHGDIAFDAYVLDNVAIDKVTGTEVTLSHTNEWCTYSVVDADGNVVKDKDGNDLTFTYDELVSAGNKIELPGAGTYKIQEKITGINFISDADADRAVYAKQSDDSDTIEITYIELDETTKPVIKKDGNVIGSTAPVVGDTLTASTSASDCTYQWFYADESGNPTGEAIGSGDTYTVKSGDAGHKLVAVATQAKDVSGETLNPPRTQASAATSKVEKKENTNPAPAAPTVASKTDTSITLSAPTGESYEYGYKVKGSTGDYTWSDEMTLTGLSANTEYEIVVREKETADTKAGTPSQATPAKTDKTPQDKPDAPAAEADAKDTISVSGAANGMKYVFTPESGDPITVTVAADGTATVVQPASGFTANFENGTLTVVGFTPDTVYNVTAAKLGDDTHQESPASTATAVKTAKDAPGATAGAKEGEAGNDGSITNVDDTMEYSDDDGATWKPVPAGATEITGLKAGPYLVHYKAVDGNPSQPSSASTRVVVGKKADDQAFDDDAKITATTETEKITVTEPVTSAGDTTVYEYRIDGGPWQKSTEFSGLEPGTTHKVEARKAETDDSMPSDPIEANVTTKAAAPASDKISTTATTLTIHDPENSTLYTVKDGDGNVVAKVQKDKDGEITTVSTADGVTVEIKNGDIVVKGLEQDKTYTVTATKIDDNNVPISGTESEGTSVKTGKHDHVWGYHFSGGSSITAECTGEGDCDIDQVVLKVKSDKTSYTFGDEINVTIENKSEFEATGATVGSVDYYDAQGNKLSGKPTDVGTYTAKVKVTKDELGLEAEPYVEFTITPKAEDAPDASLTPVIEKGGYDKVNVTNPKNGYTYEIKDKDGNVVGTTTVKADGTIEGDAAIVDGKLVFSGLAPNSKYTVEMYKKASDANHSDSARLTSNEVTTDKQPEQTPAKPTAAAKSEDTAEITGADTGNKYVFKAGDDEIVITFGEDGKPVVSPSDSGVTATIDENGKLTVSGLEPNTEYKVRAYKEPTDGNHCESDASPAATIKTAKEAPTTPAQKDLVGEKGNDGSIDGVGSTMEYKDPETGVWTAISGTEITGLKPGNYEIRYKADGDQPASESKTVEVKSKSSEGRDPVNASDIKTTTETQKITVTAPVTSDEDTTVYEYSLDGVNWQTTTEFTQIKDGNEMKDLQPGTTYQLYVRKAETETHMATAPTIVDVTTKPEAPDASKIDTTATTLTIHDPEDSTKYEVKDEEGNVIATVKIDSDGEIIGELPSNVTVKKNDEGKITDITVCGLEQEKEYTVVATKVDNNGSDISDSSDGTKKETAAHEHSWKYEVVNGNKFTATCEGEGKCDHQADGSKPLSAELVAENKVFDGSAYAASITKSDDLAVSGASVGAIEYYDKDGNKLTEAPKKKGEYTAKAVVTVGTGESAKTYTLEKAFEITKNGDNAFPEGAKPAITGWTYGDTAKDPSIPDEMKPAHGTVKYVYSDAENGTFTETVPTTAGTWYVKAIVEDSADYNACESGVTEFKIDPKPIRTSDVEWTDTSLTYNGQQQSVTPSVKASALVGEDEVNLTASDNQQTNAGNYTAKVTALSNPNYVLVPDEGKDNIEQSWSIAKATESPFANGAKPAITGWTYGDTANAPSGPDAAFGAEDIVYQYASSPSGPWSTTAPTDAGKYYVRAHVNDCANYSEANSDAQKFTIARKKVTLTWPDDPTYDGTEKDVTPTVTGLVTADEGKVSPVMDGDYKATNRKTSGQYTAKVTGLTGEKAANYEIDSTAEKTHNWNLNKGPVDPPTGVSSKPDSKVEGEDNGSITGLDKNKPMEYRLKGSNDWVAVPNGADKVEGLKNGTYEVRYAETDNTLPSEPVEVTVALKGDQTKPAAEPTVPADKVTTTTITVDPTEPGYEYIVVPKGTDPDDYNWSASKKSEGGEAITFTKDADGTNLVPGTDYEVICRKAETENADASEPGPAAEVTTTPNAPADDTLSATPTRLTIKDPEENTQYKVYDEDGNVVATVNVDKDGNVMEPVPSNVKVKENGDIVVEGLEPEKEYTVTKTKIDDEGNPKSNESAKSDPITTPALIPEDTPRKPAAESNSDGTATVELPKDGDKNVGMKYVITDEDGNETVIEVKEDGSVVNPTGGITGSIDEDGNLVIDGLASDSIYEIQAVKTPTDADNTDSERTQPPVKIKTAKEAPTSPAMKDKVGVKGNDGSIEGVDDTMEYSTDGGKSWTKVPKDATTIEGLEPGDVLVRYKEVPASGDMPKQPASEPKTVTVEKKASDQTPVAADDIKTSSTTDSVTIEKPVKEDGDDTVYEYSIDGGKTWQKTPTFTEDKNGDPLEPGKTYEVAVRKAETDDSMPSEPTTVTVSTVPEPADEPEDDERDVNSITVNPTEEGVEYIVVPKGKTPTDEDWAKAKPGNGGAVTFDGLEPGKEYEIISRTAAVKDDDGNVVTPPSAPSEPTPVYTILPEPDTSETGTKVTVDDAKKGNEYILVPKGKKPTEDDWANSLKPSEDGPVTFTGLEPSTEYDVYVRVEGNDETTSLKKTVETDPAGEYIPEVKTKGNIPEVLKVNGLSEILAKLLTNDDEHAEVRDGKDALLILEITDITGTVKANEKTLIEGFMAKISKNSTVAKYIDISLFKKVGDEDRKQLYDTKGNQIEIKFEVPENLRKKGRTFYFLRLHDGKVDVVGKTTGKAVTAKTDKFSTYALAYTDKDSGSGTSKGVKTGDMTQIYLWAAVMVAAAALLLVLFYRRRRNER